MAYEDVELLVFQGEPSYVWLEQVTEADIVEYLGRRQPTEYHPDVIPLICRFPFSEPEHVEFVCQRFHKLLIHSDKYLYQYRERIDILVFIAGFLEAAGFAAGVEQLVFHRNLLLKQAFAADSPEVLSLNHAINNLYRLKFSR